MEDDFMLKSLEEIEEEIEEKEAIRDDIANRRYDEMRENE